MVNFGKIIVIYGHLTGFALRKAVNWNMHSYRPNLLDKLRKDTGVPLKSAEILANPVITRVSGHFIRGST